MTADLCRAFSLLLKNSALLSSPSPLSVVSDEVATPSNRALGTRNLGSSESLSAPEAFRANRMSWLASDSVDPELFSMVLSRVPCGCEDSFVALVTDGECLGRFFGVGSLMIVLGRPGYTTERWMIAKAISTCGDLALSSLGNRTTRKKGTGNHLS